MDVTNRFEKVRAAIEQLGPADHVCTLYDQRDEELAIAVSYIRAGLDRRELCVCVVDDGGESILAALASEGVDIDAEMRKGRLKIFEKPLAQGLETRDMLGKIEQFAIGSRKAGHAGFRIVGEMSWALDGDLKALAEFEAQLNLTRVWERHACAGLCQFDRRRFTPETLRQMIIVHPLVVIGDRICRNPYYVARAVPIARLAAARSRLDDDEPRAASAVAGQPARVAGALPLAVAPSPGATGAPARRTRP